MKDLLRDRRRPNPASPSTYFSLDQLVSGRWFNAMCFFFGGSLALTYAAIAFDAGACLTAAKQVLLGLARSRAPEQIRNQVGDFLGTIPDWLEPVVVLGGFAFLFAAKIRSMLVFFRDRIISASGLYAIVDENTRDTSRALLLKFNNDFETLDRQLKEQYLEAPLPEEFVNNKNENRIAYQLIWRILTPIHSYGLIHSLEDVRKKMEIPSDDQGNLRFDLVRLASASFLFAVLVGLYIVLVPSLRGVIPAYFAWPNPDNGGWSSITRYILKFTLGLVFPLMLAISMYPVRRRAYRRVESETAAFYVVAAAQGAIAFIVYELFNIIDASVGVLQNQDYSLLYPRLHISAFLYSLVPIAAFWSILRLRSAGMKRIGIAIAVSLIVGTGFGICEVIYEYYLPKFDPGLDRWYFYQTLLGTYISASFFAAASITE